MALAQEDIAQIQDMIENLIAETLRAQPEFHHNNVRYELELRERIVRVEEELKHQRELLLEGFRRMDQRFEEIDRRFEVIDSRFEAIDRRFEALQVSMDKRFEMMQISMDKRFEVMDKRFETIDKRFETIDKRFELLTARIDHFMVWSFATTLTVGGLVVAAIKYLP